jgi:ketosteroid isomerase-like protein
LYGFFCTNNGNTNLKNLNAFFVSTIKIERSIMSSSTNQDETRIRHKLERWRELFSQPQFSLNGYENLYVNTDELLVYDSYSPSGFNREICGWNQYKALWEKYIPIDFPKWRIVDLKITCLEVQGDVAWSAISYVGRGMKDEKEYVGGQHGTHIWKRINDEWRIIHEHLTTMSDREIQARLPETVNE